MNPQRKRQGHRRRHFSLALFPEERRALEHGARQAQMELGPFIRRGSLIFAGQDLLPVSLNLTVAPGQAALPEKGV